MCNSVSYHRINKNHKNFLETITNHNEPYSYTEASKDPNWVKAMENEIKALKENNTWILTDLPKGRKIVGSKWIYKIKYLPNGEIERYKLGL